VVDGVDERLSVGTGTLFHWSAGPIRPRCRRLPVDPDI